MHSALGGVEITTGITSTISVSVLNSVEDEPTVLLFLTQHGEGLQRIQIVYEMMREQLSPEEVSGAIIAIPVANLLAYMHATYCYVASHTAERVIESISCREHLAGPDCLLVRRW